MKDWFIMGGTLFMSILTILLVILVAVTVYFAITIASGKASDKPNFKHQLKYVRSIGLFTLVTGILGQMIGLFQKNPSAGLHRPHQLRERSLRLVEMDDDGPCVDQIKLLVWQVVFWSPRQ